MSSADRAANPSLSRDESHWTGRFMAMASPCEVLIEPAPHAVAQEIVARVAERVWSLERRLSRYRHDNIVHAINTSRGKAVTVDDETANLIDFAATLTTLSEGRFDITSGVLRRAWTFDQGHRVPSQAEIDALLPLVGWHRVQWNRPELRLQDGMQIDFGGIGKEYAVDDAVRLAATIAPDLSCLVNLGGDVGVGRVRGDGQPWRVGVEHPDRPGVALHVIPLLRGGIATSGDARRYVEHNGKRYSHILDARTGWPVANAPRSITVAAGTCTEAGTLTTLAMLQGDQAAAMLLASGQRHWVH